MKKTGLLVMIAFAAYVVFMAWQAEPAAPKTEEPTP